MDWDALYQAALDARTRAYAPYSKFKVGAALLTRDGEIYHGCNVENRTFGLTICGERTAIASAVADGHRDYQAIAVVTDTSPPAVPCGLCLEMMNEFAADLPILAANLAGERRYLRLRELFPTPFEWPDNLEKPEK